MKKYVLGMIIGTGLTIVGQKLCKKFKVGEKLQTKFQELQQMCEMGNKEAQEPSVEEIK